MCPQVAGRRPGSHINKSQRWSNHEDENAAVKVAGIAGSRRYVFCVGDTPNLNYGFSTCAHCDALRSQNASKLSPKYIQ